MSVAILLVLVAFIEGFLHYVSRRELWSGKQLPRPLAYVLGTLGMMGPFTAWLMERGQVETAIMLWLVLGAGGVIVLITYLVDWIYGLVVSLRETREREKAALDGMHEALDAKD